MSSRLREMGVPTTNTRMLHVLTSNAVCGQKPGTAAARAPHTKSYTFPAGRRLIVSRHCKKVSHPISLHGSVLVQPPPHTHTNYSFVPGFQVPVVPVLRFSLSRSLSRRRVGLSRRHSSSGKPLPFFATNFLLIYFRWFSKRIGNTLHSPKDNTPVVHAGGERPPLTQLSR